MNTYDLSNKQVKLLKEAINAYSEQCTVFPDNEGTEERIVNLGNLYQLLSNSQDTLNTENDCSVYPICDY